MGMWSIPPKQDAEFVWRMEDVLEVYSRPHDLSRPQVCIDGKGKQLLKDVREPVGQAPGRTAREDYHYERGGVANLSIASEPLAGWRRISVTGRRAEVDFAHFVREVVDVHYPHAEKVALVMDSLNTHNPSSLYEAFEPEEARRPTERLEIHHTPKHGSWLNMAEIELSILARQCLDRRIPDQPTLRRETAAWEAERNDMESTIDWRLTTADARIKLKHLYPEISEEPSHEPNFS